MDLKNTKRGDLVKFTNENGYPGERANARRHLAPGGTYTVDRLDVYGWHSEVFLVEAPGEAFNSVMFENAELAQ